MSTLQHITRRPYVRHAALFIASIAIGLVLVFGARAAVERLQPPTYFGTLLEPALPIADAVLTAHTGEQVRLSDYRGALLVLFFGYTTCPDVCPATLGRLAAATALLGDDASGAQVAMVTVDPLRDTPPQLAAYMSKFHAGFLGLTAEPEVITELAASIGIYYEPYSAGPETLVDHSSGIAVLDSEGNLRLILPSGASGAEIANDLRNLLRGRS